jgi:uncharacterized membrane protein YhaH (DUF805 family)
MDWDIFTTEGRIRRTHYAIYLVVIGVVASLAGALADLVGDGASLLVLVTAFVGQAWSSYCVMVRRAHDAGRSAGFVVWAAVIGAIGGCLGILAVILIAAGDASATITMIGAVILLLISIGMTAALFFWPPDGDNEWGVDPR